MSPGFLKRLFGRGPRFDNIQGGPVRLEIEPGLQLDVCAHKVGTEDGSVSCVSYVSDGLLAHGQAEVILTLAIDSELESLDTHSIASSLFEGLFALAKADQTVSVGGVTRFSGDGILGRKAILYGESEVLEGVRSGPPLLSALLITEAELNLADCCGYLRVLTMLGKYFSYFPYPPWSDLARSDLPGWRNYEQSFLFGVPRVRIPGVTCVRRGDEVTLYLPRDGSAAFRTSLEKSPPRSPFAILADLDPAADSCMVWNCETGQLAAIRPSSSTSKATSGCFLSIGYDMEENFGTVLEDGYAFGLTTQSWSELREALLSCREHTIRAENEVNCLGLVIAWRDDG